MEIVLRGCSDSTNYNYQSTYCSRKLVLTYRSSIALITPSISWYKCCEQSTCFIVISLCSRELYSIAMQEVTCHLTIDNRHSTSVNVGDIIYTNIVCTYQYVQSVHTLACRICTSGHPWGLHSSRVTGASRRQIQVRQPRRGERKYYTLV